MMQGNRKSQSAMEYLMTYGWAILAIAIVMVSLYSLGIFNTGSLQPTATPGSCEVVRTAAQTSLAGQCSNLIPKYVGKFSGQNSYVNVGKGSQLNLNTSLTTSFWLYVPVVPVSANSIIDDHDNTGSYSQYDIAISFTSIGASTGDISFSWGVPNAYRAWYTSSVITAGKWYQVVLTRAGAGTPSDTVTVYVNAVSQSLTSTGGAAAAAAFSQVGNTTIRGITTSDGLLANVQIYNTSLDSASVKALYQEGIGGTPIDVNHLVGWWPLNGNANDYSGNNNQGTSTNVTWSANWQSGYTAPTS